VARADDDTWDITESVGATALGVASARAGEAAVEHPLFSDPYAQLFLDAAAELGWKRPYSEKTLAEMAKVDPHLAERMQAMSGYAASRTKFFDDFFGAAATHGVRQAVILAAGLDARAWRLPWPEGTVVYEIDQPKVLDFKADTLQRHGAQPTAGYVAVPVDLRQDWPQALRDAGFDPEKPSAWTAEGLLPYLPAEAQDLLFDRIADLSAPGSRVAVEAFSPTFFAPDVLARRTAQIRQAREAAARAGETHPPDTDQLFYLEDRGDVTDWWRDHGWVVTATDVHDLMAGYGRPAAPDVEDATPHSVFVEGQLP
jgi:methyltransferase (TIGR00027 family)